MSLFLRFILLQNILKVHINSIIRIMSISPVWIQYHYSSKTNVYLWKKELELLETSKNDTVGNDNFRICRLKYPKEVKYIMIWLIH